jgi:hypothetical protein
VDTGRRRLSSFLKFEVASVEIRNNILALWDYTLLRIFISCSRRLSECQIPGSYDVPAWNDGEVECAFHLPALAKNLAATGAALRSSMNHSCGLGGLAKEKGECSPRITS